MRSTTTCTLAVLLLGLSAASLLAEESWSIDASAEWKQATASSKSVAIHEGAVFLRGAHEGQWTNTWHTWQNQMGISKIIVEAEINLFNNKQIQTIVKGAQTPYTDRDGVEHDWYGRCMIAIVDEHRWIMELQSGVNHINWGKGDTIHLITSTNQGRTWSR